MKPSAAPANLSGSAATAVASSRPRPSIVGSSHSPVGFHVRRCCRTSAMGIALRSALVDEVWARRPVVGEEIARQSPEDEAASRLQPLDERLQQLTVLLDERMAYGPYSGHEEPLEWLVAVLLVVLDGGAPDP